MKILVWVLIIQRNVDITKYIGKTVDKNLETKIIQYEKWESAFFSGSTKLCTVMNLYLF